MFWFFGNLNQGAAWLLFQFVSWIVIPGIALILCLFRVKPPEYPFDGQSCLDQTEDAVKDQDDRGGVAR